MKNNDSFSKLLGISQLDAAMLLMVSRSRWSMHEVGKRDLPLHSRQLLAEMLAYVQSRANSLRDAAIKPHYANMQHLKRLVKENEFKQSRLDRRMEIAQRKQDTQLRLSYLAEFLTARAIDGKIDAVHQIIINKAAKTAKNNFNTNLVKYELQKEVLAYQKLQLESKIKMLGKDEAVN